MEAYVLTLLAALGTVGVFSLFAVASGILRFVGRDQGNPLLKSVVDGAFDGIVVSDQAGRVLYANATYLDLIGAADLHARAQWRLATVRNSTDIRGPSQASLSAGSASFGATLAPPPGFLPNTSLRRSSSCVSNLTPS